VCRGVNPLYYMCLGMDIGYWTYRRDEVGTEERMNE